MSSESLTRINQHSRLRKVFAVSAAALCLAGCTSNEQSSGAKSTEKNIQLVPNMENYTKPGDSTRCLNGGERPCALLLRTKPERSAAIINATKETVTVEWPKESYHNTQGAKLTVRCYDPNGEKLTSSENNLVSSDWYQVFVPKEHAINSEAYPDSITIGNEQMYLGWASVTWFNQTAHDPAVPRC